MDVGEKALLRLADSQAGEDLSMVKGEATPKRQKRHLDRRKEGRWPVPGDGLEGALKDIDCLARLGLIATSFVHLEKNMATVLAILLGGNDMYSAGMILNSIKSPRARADLMKTLLEKNILNKNLGEEYDEILKEFQEINIKRNFYVHGLWYTTIKTNRTLLSPVDVEGLEYLTAREVNPEEMDDLIKRIYALNVVINRGPLQLIGVRAKARRAAQIS